MSVINFDSENLVVDWISFNLEGLTDSKRIARRLFSCFNGSITMDDQSKIRFSDRRNRYDVLIHQYRKSHWIGTQIIFSRKYAPYF